MKLYTFRRGGIHPAGEKGLSEQKPIRDIQLPDKVFIGMNQHLGKPARVLVEAKQEVKVGDLIGEPDGFISANVHSSVSGTVSKIDLMASAMGTMEQTVIIDVEKEQTEEGLKAFDPVRDFHLEQADPKELVECIRNAGIVGEGGATFPTNVKLTPPADKTIDTLMLNGAECEPFLTANHRLMLEKTEEILKGTLIVQRILGVEKTYIGIEDNKMDAIEAFEKTIRSMNLTEIEVARLKTKYPQGGEKQLIYAVMGREVPSGKLPLDVGVVVQNVGTIFAIYEAVYHGKPLIDRITTITGYVNEPGNFRLLVGTSFEHAIESGTGGLKDRDKVRAIINGGPMMGKAVRQLDVSVMKGTSGILAFSDDDFEYVEEGPCIRCGRCVDICPMGLMPTELAKAARHKEAENLGNAMDCLECGSCGYVCPTSRHLVHWIRIGKAAYKNANRS